MDETNESRRSFLRVAGVAALSGLCGLPQFGCDEDDQSKRVPTPDGFGELMEVREGLFRPTARGATIHWIPNGVVESQVLAGRSESELAVVYDQTSADPVRVVLDQFDGMREFHWQIRHRRKGQEKWQTTPTARCRLARRPGETFTAALFADSHFDSARNHPKTRENITLGAQAVIDDHPDFGVFIGDEVGITVGYLRKEPGVRQDASLAMTRWLEWRQFIGALLANVPTFFVLGNHEGEAGYYQDMNLKGDIFAQRWSTIARKRYFLNPLPTTYPEGGEDEGWRGSADRESTGGADEGNCSPLENYFAWTWGDALFAVIDVHRYTKVGRNTPRRPEDWSLGAPQRLWLEHVLGQSNARWKFVLSHHVVGGSKWDSSGRQAQPAYAYGRGGAQYCRIGEQAMLTDIMKKHGAQFFVYGHDHIFAHQQAEGIHYICCGRPTRVPNTWVTAPGFMEAYGDYRARDPHAFIMDVGYTRLTVSPSEVVFEYVKTGMDPDGNENIKANVGDVVHRVAVS